MGYITLPLVVPGQALTTSPVVYYMSPVGTNTRIQILVLNNTDTAPHVCSIYLTSSSGSPVLSDTLATVTIPAGVSQVVYQATNQSLLPGGCIQAIADVGGVVIIMAGGVQSS